MGSRKTHDGAEKVYEAAQRWVDCALRADDSLFTPGKAIWSSQWLQELRERFLDRPDEGGGDFYEKLETQLEGSPPEAYQLMAEVLYSHFLIIWSGTMRADTKEERIERVVGWSEQEIEIPAELAVGLTAGIANIGQARSRHFPFYVGFLIEFVQQWKELEPDECQRLLADPWAFKAFATQLVLRGQLFRESPNAYRVQQEALLHLVFPDHFEGTVSIEQKTLIAEADAFAHFITDRTADVDRRIQQIRQGVEAGLNRDFDYYDPDIRIQWSSDFNPWDEFVKRAQEYLDTGRLERDEILYKLEIGHRVAAARKAVLNNDDGWAGLVKRGISSNLIHHISLARFRDWVDGSKGDALRALQALWTRSDAPVAERIRAFDSLLPKSDHRSDITGPGTRMNVVSVLLMGLDVEQYPPFRITVFEKAYERTGYYKSAHYGRGGVV